MNGNSEEKFIYATCAVLPYSGDGRSSVIS